MIRASSGMVSSLYARKLSWYVTNCLVELSLAIPLWVDAVSDVNKDLGLKAKDLSHKAKDSGYQCQIFHRSSPYSVHHFFIVNVV